MKKDRVIFTSSLCKQYQTGDTSVEALREIDFEAWRGDFVTISGLSGAGKTTFLNIIGGLDKPTSGEVWVFGHKLSAYDEDFLATFRSSYVGYVFQSYNLISTLTTLENISFSMQSHGWPIDRIEKRSKELIKLVGLGERANHFPSQLSGGELQRAAFARALANNPPLLLVDEPTGNLDLDTGLKIIGILEHLKNKKTVVVATHDRRIVDISDKVVILSNGRIISVG